MNRYYAVVAERANHRCEYCHAPELVFNFPLRSNTLSPSLDKVQMMSPI
ncbi:hypothetical protein NIES4073_68720 [Kalymmatonema gypsitolerans NIES-4073]|nr:hypothetical protein NIES4073_68720 [Scytonema sp. NIES-4073]